MAGIDLTSTTNGAHESKSFLSGIDVQTAPVHVGDSTYEEFIPEESVDITLGVFFDGTQNNRKNTEARLEHQKKATDPTKDYSIAAKYIFEEGSSFENDYSNIARGEPHYVKKNEEKHKQLSVYIEGIGTENYEEDSWILGVAQGKGDTGVPAKVKKACEDVAKEIYKAIKIDGVTKINTLKVDTFGFSRGGAAARYFIYRITKRKGQLKKRHPRNNKKINYKVDWGTLGEELNKLGIEVKMLKVRFVGLYDTVASYGIDHDTDTDELKLNAIQRADHVFQIGADDEHRVKFRRTDIKSAGSKGKEVLFPGVHSDIGGGYLDNENENLKVVFKSHFLNEGEAEKEYLIEQGWYRPNELKVNKWNGHLQATRKNISNKYSFIPLHCMSEYGLKKSVDFKINKIKRAYKIENQILTWAKRELDKYIEGERGKLSFENPNEREQIKILRHDYFHFSAHYKRVYGFIPNKPNIENGKRTRVINPG
ncbi:T6SS phospholipase effector Tle1-like catalytic domain-containing protein [Maribacter luteus]|uniref:T6SS phospholipase effector Tle1-like catalytic domain-containing protein n=1 Tax=Maribacter luteus TaxID=2594478 RepID=UPI00248F6315|nr:DUF2235 domain-containing protein [Maribacter luteus]